MADPDTLSDSRTRLQGAMDLLAALAGGLEDGIGDTAKSVTYVAGKNLGRQFAGRARRTRDLQEALEQLRQILLENQCLWLYERFQPKAREEWIERTGDGEQGLLVFRDCMIRQSLFRSGHAQRGTLCNLMFGFFAGALERIMGCEANLEIVHAGENACLKRLSVRTDAAEEADA